MIETTTAGMRVSRRLRPRNSATAIITKPTDSINHKALNHMSSPHRLFIVVGYPGPKFRQYKLIRAHPETCLGLGRFIDALLSLAAAFFGGDASSHRRAGRMHLGFIPRSSSSPPDLSLLVNFGRIVSYLSRSTYRARLISIGRCFDFGLAQLPCHWPLACILLAGAGLLGR
jgi:hypothetical protein